MTLQEQQQLKEHTCQNEKKEGHVLNRCCAAESLLGPCVFVEIICVIFWLDKG